MGFDFEIEKIWKPLQITAFVQDLKAAMRFLLPKKKYLIKSLFVCFHFSGIFCFSLKGLKIWLGSPKSKREERMWLGVGEFLSQLNHYDEPISFSRILHFLETKTKVNLIDWKYRTRGKSGFFGFLLLLRVSINKGIKISFICYNRLK